MHTECRPTEVGCAVVGAPDSGVKHGPRATALRGEFAALARGMLPQGVSLSGMRERGFLRAFGIGGPWDLGVPWAQETLWRDRLPATALQACGSERPCQGPDRASV